MVLKRQLILAPALIITSALLLAGCPSPSSTADPEPSESSSVTTPTPDVTETEAPIAEGEPTPGVGDETSPDCTSVVTMLATPDPTVREAEEIEVSIAPAGCLATSQWAGEIIVRTQRGDYPTGARMDLGASSTTVSLPAGVSGEVFVMLVPDQECADVFTSGDCHYPYVSVAVEP